MLFVTNSSLVIFNFDQVLEHIPVRVITCEPQRFKIELGASLNVMFLFEPEQLKHLLIVAIEGSFQEQFIVVIERWIVQLVLEIVEIADKERVFSVKSPRYEATNKLNRAGL